MSNLKPADFDRLSSIRERIQALDDQIIECFQKRFVLCSQLGEMKKQLNLPLENKQVESSKQLQLKTLLEDNSEHLSQAELELLQDFVEKLYNLTFSTSKKLQNGI